MMSHSENHAAGASGCQVNGVQPDYMEVVPSRREAIGFAVSIFNGAGASAIDVMKMAEAIHQFLIGELCVDLTDDYGKSLFPVNNLAGLPEELENVSAVGNRGVSEFSSAMVEDAGAALVFARGDACRNFPDESFSGGRYISAHKESSFLVCGKNKMDGAGSSDNATARSADASKTV